MDKQFIPVIAIVIAAFLIMLIRPSPLVHSSKDPNCPYCLNPWLTTLVLLLVGGVAYLIVNQDRAQPSMRLF